MSALATFAISTLACAGGVVVAWWIQSRSDERERARIAREMTARVNERYAAYVELEQRITRAIEEFDICEAEYKDHMDQQGAAFLDSLRDTAAPEAEEAARELRAQMEELERSSRELREQKEAEIERQAAVIQELSVSLSDMRPGSDELAERESEIERLAARVRELEPLTEQLAQREEQLAALRAANEELSNQGAADEDTEVVSFFESLTDEAETPEPEDRTALRDEAVERAEALAAELEESRREAEDRSAQRDEAVVRAEALAAELAENRREAEELQRRVAELDQYASTGFSEMKKREAVLQARNESLSKRVGELAGLEEDLADRERTLTEEFQRFQEERAAAAGASADQEERIRELEAVAAETDAVQARIDELESQCMELETARATEVDALTKQVEMLKPLRKELSEGKRRLAELEEHCASLERSKKRAARNLANLREELADSEAEIWSLGQDPQDLAAERRERKARIQACIDALDPIAQEIDDQADRVSALERYYTKIDREKDGRIETLEGRVAELYPLCDSVESLIGMVVSSKEQAEKLEHSVHTTQASLNAQLEAHAGLCEAFEDLAPALEKAGLDNAQVRKLKKRYDKLVEKKDAEVAQLEEAVEAMQPVAEAIESLLEMLSSFETAK